MTKPGLEGIIRRFISQMQGKYDVLGAMLTGSYVTGTMMPNSDIDVFFLWGNERESMRGRTFFEGVEFEYFFSPEWKYYDRLKGDLVAQRIYAAGKIVLDSGDRFRRIQQEAQKKVQAYQPEMSPQEKVDLSFQVETIMKDGMDLLEADKRDSFRYLAGLKIPQLCGLAAKVQGKYPMYEKYAMEQLKALDARLFELVQGLYHSDGEAQLAWQDLCRYVLELLGNPDIRDYQSITPITNKENA